MSSILVTCRDKANLQKHYIPALRLGGWEQELVLLGPGDTIPSLEAFAGLLLTGGNDIHARCWDLSEPLHPSAEVDEGRDALEIPVAREAWRLGLPILGICRGEQVLNVAFGGSLIQDIPSRFGCELDRHRGGRADTPYVQHRVALDPNSRLAAMLGVNEIGVNSRHHQAVDGVAPGLKAVGWSKTSEGLIESIEAVDSGRWVFGVQWHPENLVSLDDGVGLAARRIFEGFAQAADAWKSN